MQHMGPSVSEFVADVLFVTAQEGLLNSALSLSSYGTVKALRKPGQSHGPRVTSDILALKTYMAGLNISLRDG